MPMTGGRQSKVGNSGKGCDRRRQSREICNQKKEGAGEVGTSA